MAFFLNVTESIGQIIISSTQNTTGDIVLTLFIIFLFILAACITFSIPLEITGIIVLPYLLICASIYQFFYGPLALDLIFLALVVARSLWFR